ncbi:MAG: hypothetical protein LBU83_05830 [Bacteroidales bacterium]|jgi:hypothetical protein|nr:hypothetical protein [Bacteroidales bacterium]
MEKPTGVIQKIIESLQQVNALDIYSPIEKDIILHNLRAAYMIFLNVSADDNSTEKRVDELAFQTIEPKPESNFEENQTNMKIEEDWKNETEEPEHETEDWKQETEEPEHEIEDWKQETEEPEHETEDKEIEEEIDTKPLIENIFIEEPIELEEPLVDDILEFIPDAKPHSGLLFDDMNISKPERKSLNELLVEKKEEQTVGMRFQQSYIPDLTKAIAINEKFSFIRELFRNSGVDFSNAIQKLNECENIDTAFTLMEELKHQYLWDTTSTSYLSLCDLVRRRFL